MSGRTRTYVLILFFWALLTIVTPMLVRMSASANLYKRFDHGERREDLMLLLRRRGLIAADVSRSLAPAPAVEGGISDRDVLFDVFRGLIAADVSRSLAPAPAVEGGISDRDVLFDVFVNHFDRT